ncbi:hypothetical protein QJS66_10580 [Kocuria rhizophila]|nr:hypothetical protein QJS66_10580 [Kocuria rhizophila]
MAEQAGSGGPLKPAHRERSGRTVLGRTSARRTWRPSPRPERRIQVVFVTRRRSAAAGPPPAARRRGRGDLLQRGRASTPAQSACCAPSRRGRGAARDRGRAPGVPGLAVRRGDPGRRAHGPRMGAHDR